MASKKQEPKTETAITATIERAPAPVPLIQPEPDYSGYDQAEASDLVLPLLRLEQKKKETQGQWFRVTDDRPCSDAPFVPIKWEKKWVLWWKMDNPSKMQGVIATYDREQDCPPEDRMHADKQLRETHCWYVLLDGEELPSVIRCHGTALRASGGMLTQEVMASKVGRPPGKYALQSETRENEMNSWYVPKFTRIGDASEDDWERLKVLRAMLGRSHTIVADEDTPREVDKEVVPEEEIPF